MDFPSESFVRFLGVVVVHTIWRQIKSVGGFSMDWVLRSVRSRKAKNSRACKLSDLLFA